MFSLITHWERKGPETAGRNTGAEGGVSWLAKDLKSVHKTDCLFQLDAGENPSSPAPPARGVCFYTTLFEIFLGRLIAEVMYV